MNLTNYIKSLFPTFKKDKVIESCELTKQSIQEHSLPSYQAAVELFKGREFKSKEAKDFSIVYSKNVDKSTGVEMVSSIRDILSNATVLLDHISNISKNEFSQTESSIALTYKKSTYLRTVSAAEFMSIYSRKFLNYIYVLETNKADSSVSVKGSVLAIEIKWLEDNFLSFCEVCRILQTAKDKYDRLVKDIPEATISELTETTFPETVGLSKIDPLRMKNLSVTWNPFYHIGLAVAAYQVDRYKSSRTEMELLQMRKLNLEKTYANEPDAKLQKEIDYLQTRVDNLNYKIKQFEEENNV